MKHPFAASVLLLAAMASTTMANFKLEVGKTTSVKLRLVNHNADPIRNLRLRMKRLTEWLDIKMPETLTVEEKNADGEPVVWSIEELSHGTESALELTLEVTIRGREEEKKDDKGGAGQKGKKEDKSNEMIGERGYVRFILWKEDENPGQERKEVEASDDRLGVPKWRSWQVEYGFEATYEELAKDPTDMEWHLVDARRGSEGNQITLKIHNKSEFKPLLNVTVIPDSPPGPVTVARRGTAEDKIIVANVQGMRVIEKEETGEFKVSFSVGKDARPGTTDTVFLRVYTSTLGASPNPWDPVVMVNVAARHSGLKGNFEAFVYYNLAPLKDDKKAEAPQGVDETTWMPVPKGTKVTVSQIYSLLLGNGERKTVEQFVGYGNVIDEKGYFICHVVPAKDQRVRFRLVAETIANVLEVKYKDDHQDEIESIVKKSSRAAVTPFGKRVFRCISYPFLVEKEKAASILEEKALETREHEELAGAERREFWRAKPSQEFKFVIGRKVLIPYYGYAHDVDPKRDKGISINWQGELSTGGLITHLGSPMSNIGTMARVPLGIDSAYDDILARTTSDVGNQRPGITYHNHNELLHVLSALIRAQESVAKLAFFNAERRKARAEAKAEASEGEEEEEEEAPKLPGVIAYWRKSAWIEGGETGYALRDDGTWRLVVQALPKDPDERDIGLVLRGYGAAIRRRFWEPNEQETEDEQKKPNYPYYTRTSVREAWEQGFDTFFAASVLNSPKVENRLAMDAKEREKRSVDLDDIFVEAHFAAGDKMYDDKYRRIRGADNAVAVAAGLWRAAQALTAERLIDEILFEKGGNITWFLNFARTQQPDLVKEFAILGLCPTVDRYPPVASIKEGVSPEALKMIWHPNDVVAKGKVEASIVFGSPNSDKLVRLPIKGTKSGKAAVIFDFDQLRDGKEGEGQLSLDLHNGQKCFWTIESTIEKSTGGQKKKLAFIWPLQDFVAALPSASVAGRGRTLFANSRGRIHVPGDATDHTVGMDNHRINSVLGGRRVLGGAVYSVRIDAPDPRAPGGKEFRKPVEIVLSWREEEDPGDATPAIYFLSPETHRWDLVGTERVGKRDIKAIITRAGSYALMVDHLPPNIEGLIDVPDPFPATVEGATWKLSARLSEPCVVTVQIADGEGKALRTLLQGVAKPVGPLEVTWDGKDAGGKLVPDGVYTYRLLARDESKLEAKPVTGTVTVLTGDFGSADGEVKVAAESEGAPSVRLVGSSLTTDCDADGKYWLLGLVTGTHTLRFSAQGHFEEERPVELKTKGDMVTVPLVPLTNVALTDLQASSEVFTPDGDGENDYLSVRFKMVRECPLDVGVYDSDDELVATLQAREPMTKGDAVVLWRGHDDDDERQPSGWYTIHFIAHSRTEGIPQGDVKVLLDRGLVQNAHAFPNTFSPNADGFDDMLEIGYDLEDEALVTIHLFRNDGTLLKELLTDKEQEEGWTIVKWDGKGPDGQVVPDGKYAFEIRPKYLTGHESIVVRRDFMADSLPPQVGKVEPINGSRIKTGLPTVTARIVSDLADIDPSQLKIKIDEQTVIADAYDEKTGLFSFTPKTSLGEGVHIAIAYAQDWAGNYAPPQAVSFKVTLAEGDEKFLDRTKPEILDLQPSKGTIVYTATPLITARVRDADSGIDLNNIMIYLNGERVSNAVRLFLPGKSGKSWDWYYYEKAIVLYEPLRGEVRYVPMEPMKEGKNHVSLEVLDKSGNRSAKAEAVFEIVIDDGPPKISALSPANGATLARTAVTVSAKLADAGKSGLAMDTLRVSVDAKELPLAEADMTFDEDTGQLTIPLQVALARDAQHAIQLTVRDRAGNLCEPAVSVFNIVEDGDAPRIDVLSPRPNTGFAQDATVLFAAALYDLGRSGIDEPSVVMLLDNDPIPRDDPKTVKAEGYLLIKGLLTHKLEALAPGRHVISLTVDDRAGNRSTTAVCQFEVK